MTLKDLKRVDEALASCDRAITIKPDYAEANSNRGITLKELKRLDEALASYDRAIILKPDYAEASYNRSITLQELKRLDEALVSYDRAIALKPDYAEAYSNRGNALKDLKRVDEALASYDRAIVLKPDYADAYSNRGLALQALKRLDEALASYDRAIVLKPDYAEAYSNRGNALKDLNRLDEALASYDRALVLKPDYAEVYSNRGLALQDLKRLDEALASYDRAIVLKPDLADVYWNKSLLKILTGDYLEGWQLYEWRWKKEPLINSLRVYKKPLWLGTETLVNKTLLIYPEQGLGDYIQCIRYAVLVEQLGAKVILEVPLALMSLVSTLKGQFTLVESGKPLPDFDYHCPVMSLPLAFKTTVDTIPAQLPYLYATEDKKQHWQEKLGKQTVTRIGLVWSGSTGHKNDHNRSLLLQQLASLLELPVEFYSLQKEVRAVDIDTLIAFHHIHQHQDDLLDFSDTAALVDAMDIIISVDTSVAHLAGAMGKKVFILLPYAADYRWMLDRTDSPWYPTATLFRQPALDDWESVVVEIKQLLIN
jgi:tetratricopeptide (TPR) repeat protein